jgi:hypothetical protein
MKRSILAVLLFASAASLSAQSMKLRANVPFDFRLGEALMPAGEYRVDHANDVVQFHSLTRAKAALSITRTDHRKTAAPAGSGALIFNKIGESYFLAGVYPANSPVGRALPKTKAEKELTERSGGRIQTAAVLVPAK